MKYIFKKQPAEVVDYDIDFGTLWMAAGDSIVSANAAADSGIALGATSINSVTHDVKQWISGGESGQKYKVQVTITTALGRIKEFEFYVMVREI